jgi:hypothetical protein
VKLLSFVSHDNTNAKERKRKEENDASHILKRTKSAKMTEN